VKQSTKRETFWEKQDKIEVKVDQKHPYVQFGAERIKSEQDLLQLE
jgi:hypothetical protein